jgi:hypothetical protein
MATTAERLAVERPGRELALLAFRLGESPRPSSQS